MEKKKINIIPGPSVMAERDEVLAKAYKDYRNKNYEFDKGSNPKQTN